MVNERENLVEGVDRSGGIYYNSGLASMRGDQMEGTMEMDAGFLVD